MYGQNVGGMSNMFGFPNQFQPMYNNTSNGPFSRNTHAAQGIPWVGSIDELSNVFTPPGVPVLFMNRNTNEFYIKETSNDGVSFVKEFTFDAKVDKPDVDSDSYVTLDQLNDYMKKVDDKIESFIQRTNAAATANEPVNAAATNGQSNAIPVDAYTINDNGPVVRSGEEWKSYTSKEPVGSNGQVWQANPGATGQCIQPSNPNV